MTTPEQDVAAWREENRDDDANHNFEGARGKCVHCGDDEGGLLHAFDPNLPEGYHDEAIYEVVATIRQEDG